MIDEIGESPSESYALDGDVVNESANVAEWQAATALLFDAHPLDDPSGRRFVASLSARRLGPLLMGRARSGPHRFVRDTAVLARGGSDWVLVQWYVAGGFVGTADANSVVVAPGDIVLFDLAATFETRSTAFENLNLLIPRADFVRENLPPEALHGLVLARGSVAGDIVRRHLLTIEAMAQQLGDNGGDTLATVTFGVIAAALRDALRGRGAPPPMRTTLDAVTVHRYIVDHIADPALDVAGIARHFGVSRATLYRVFAPLGSIAGAIRRERLRRAFDDLRADSGDRMRVGIVARRWGFASPSGFSRAFRSAFGLSPHDVVPGMPRARLVAAENRLAQWIAS